MDTSRPGIGHLMNVVRVATVLAIYWMDRFPSVSAPPPLFLFPPPPT